MQPIILPKYQLKELYFNQKISSMELGQRFGVSGKTVLGYLEKYGFKPRPIGWNFKTEPIISKDKLIRLRQIYRLDRDIAELLNVSPSVITFYSKKYNLLSGKRPLKDLNKSILEELYISKKLTTSQIAELYHVKRTSVNRMLRKHGIIIRTHGESQKQIMSLPEYKEKYSHAMRLSHSRPEVKAKIATAAKNRVVSKETRKKLSEAGQRYVPTEETRKKSSERIKKYIKEHPEFIKNLHNNHLIKMANRDFTPNKTENKVYTALKNYDIYFIPQFIIKNKFLVDALIPQANIILQIDGDWWHGNKTKYPILNFRQERQIIKDRSQDAYLIKCGYKVKRIWESDIKLKLEEIIRKIENEVKLCQKDIKE